MHFDLATSAFTDVERDPQRPAVIAADRSLSWDDFRRAVDDWVAAARDLGVGPDIPVVIYGHKEAQFLVAMAGCLSLKAPFVPVDTIYPDERMQRIAAIVKAPVIYLSAEPGFRRLGHVALEDNILIPGGEVFIA